MPTLKSRLGDWQLDHVHAWSDREERIRAEAVQLVDRSTKVATIGSCFAQELAKVMGTVAIQGGMHPGGLFYSTATIRQELERIAGGWPERAADVPWQVDGGLVDPFRDYDTRYPDEAALLASRAEADAAADALFRGARVVVVTLGLIETWRSPTTGNTYRQIPHPAVFPTLGAVFHRLTVAEMLDDLERIRTVVRDHLGAELIVTTSPVPLHTTFTPLDVRVANVESKSRIRAAVSEFVDRHPDVRYFHSYEMVVTAERQSDYFRDDGRHVHRHAVQYIVSRFLDLFGDRTLQLPDVDTSWITPISKTAAIPSSEARPRAAAARPAPASFPRRAARSLRRRFGALIGAGR
ncbi:MAG TPA: GSCFA domain-containing protein [Candidatus Limnocylindrales bacterium]|nr:GSCFA domain-containing protein [Candidatus Limnocylindrales bacterium]